MLNEALVSLVSFQEGLAFSTILEMHLQDHSYKCISRHRMRSRKLTPFVKCGLRAEGRKHQPSLATAKGGSCEPEDLHFKQAPPPTHTHPGIHSIVLA